LRCCVFPGVEEILAKPSTPVIMFISDDLPTFERPMKAYSGRSAFGQLFNAGKLPKNFIVLIII
jgi:hypothetical protein